MKYAALVGILHHARFRMSPMKELDKYWMYWGLVQRAMDTTNGIHGTGPISSPHHQDASHDAEQAHPCLHGMY